MVGEEEEGGGEGMRSKAIELIQKLRKAEEKGAKLLEELERSLAIEELWPDAFKHGSVKSHLEWNNQDVMLVIRNSEETRSFHVKDVPFILVESMIKQRIEKEPTEGRKAFWRRLLRGLKAKEKKS
ncbi:hypothetical protein IIA15_00325 [candidate division TA06 bacterium]|nr:hypothetical protein [candidate division TA06 bacterium]